jgi:hypothetical protein
MSSNPTSMLVDQMTAGWEQAQTAAKQWWDASWVASDQLRAAVEGWTIPAAARPASHDKHHRHERRCCDPCACCVPSADVVLRARAFERRVVPFTLHNPTRRELKVSLELGPFHGCDGDELDISGRFDQGEQITLAPCETRQVRLMLAIEVAKASSSPADPAKPGDQAPERTGHGDVVVVKREFGDVSRCSTAYGDVRFEGCGRPMRVAVVVQPAECDAVDVRCGCDCGCC